MGLLVEVALVLDLPYTLLQVEGLVLVKLFKTPTRLGEIQRIEVMQHMRDTLLQSERLVEVPLVEVTDVGPPILSVAEGIDPKEIGIYIYILYKYKYIIYKS